MSLGGHSSMAICIERCVYPDPQMFGTFGTKIS